MTKGGKNLLLLGIIAILVAGSTTGVSLALYHNSGDIYLDRSRPGFLPDEDEIEGNNDDGEEYVFQKSGKLTIKDTEEYLKELDEVEYAKLKNKTFVSGTPSMVYFKDGVYEEKLVGDKSQEETINFLVDIDYLEEK